MTIKKEIDKITEQKFETPIQKIIITLPKNYDRKRKVLSETEIQITFFYGNDIDNSIKFIIDIPIQINIS